MELKLGNLILKSGVVQSPMAGCTDLAFRLIARRRGMEFSFLEMISSHALAHENQRSLRILESLPEDRPLGAQLVGSDPEVMARAAIRVEELGFDLLDLNLGCPAPKIVCGGEGAGSALLKQPEKAGRIFRAVSKAVKRIPVTVKMRLGFHDASGREAIEVGKRAQDAGVCAAWVHGRTRGQGYSGKADYEAIGRVKKALSIPVVGNGDVFTGADAKRLVEVSGCDGVMLGRGALGNPWIYREVEASLNGIEARCQAPEERLKTLLEHMDLEVRCQGEPRAALHMRRIGCWYVSGMPGAALFRREACKTKSTAEIAVLIENFRRSLPTSS